MSNTNIADGVYAYAPEADEPDYGLVNLATDHGVIAILTPAVARKLMRSLEAAIEAAEEEQS